MGGTQIPFFYEDEARLYIIQLSYQTNIFFMSCSDVTVHPTNSYSTGMDLRKWLFFPKIKDLAKTISKTNRVRKIRLFHGYTPCRS